MTFVSHAQNFEDVLLWRALCDVGKGRYLDIGAHDPVIDSVSLAFYDAGWRGIHVEPVPESAAKLREARPDEAVLQAAASDRAGPITFYQLGGLSSGRREIAEHHKRSGHEPREILVPCSPLDQLLDCVDGEIHWMKVDVEGMEQEVLRSWRGNEKRPWALVIESTFPNAKEPTHHQWIQLVLDRGYREVFFDGLSRYFLHSDHLDRAKHFDSPPNVFDAFTITASHFSAKIIRGELDEARRLLTGEEKTASDLRLRLSNAEEQASNERARSTELQSQVAQARQRLAVEQSTATDLKSRLEVAQHAAAAARHRAEEASSEAAEARRRQAEAAIEIAAGSRRFADRVEVLSHQYQAREEELRSSLATETAELRDKLDNSRTAEIASRVNLATFQERVSSLEATVATLTGQLESSRASAEHAIGDLRQELDRERSMLDEARAAIAHADDLIRRAREEPPGGWQRIGEALGLSRASTARHALYSWSFPDLHSDRPASSNSPAKGREQNMTSSGSSESRNPYLRASSLDELLSWDGVDFVRCAYVTVLGRQPDVDGEAFYTDRLRSGEHKMQILWQLRRSAEAARHDPGIAGFDRALRKARSGRWIQRLKRGGRPDAERSHDELSSPAAADGAETPLAELNANRIEDLATKWDGLAREIETLKGIVDGLGHAVRGIADAQVRQEQEIRTLRSLGRPADHRRASASARIRTGRQRAR